MVFERALQIPEERYPEDRVMDNIHAQSGTITVRMGFYKVGALQFISHLDLQRAMKRAFLRSGLPIWFSEGFNPHPKMVFSTPLSIGVESICEFADVKMTETITPREVMTRLNACMPETLQLFYAAPPVHKMTEIGWSSYLLKLYHPLASADMAEKLMDLYSRPLIILKKSKSGDRDTDISPSIRRAEAVFHSDEGAIFLEVLLGADNAHFLNPEYLIKAAARDLGLSFEDPETSWYTILRTGIFLTDGKTPFC